MNALKNQDATQNTAPHIEKRAPRLRQNMAFSDEQAMLLEAATAFCRERSTSALVRQRLGTDTGFDATLWQDMVAMGWLGLAVPEAQGGSGLGLGHLAVLAEPMGRHLLATPFASTQLAVAGLLGAAQAGDERHQAELAALAQGRIASVALFEESGDWAIAKVDAVTCRAETAGDQVRLSGIKCNVTDGLVADALLVSVVWQGELALAWLPTSALPAGAMSPEVLVDSTRRSARLTLDGTELPASALITGAAAQAALRQIQQTGWLLGAAEAAGGIAGVLDVVVEYLNTRKAFGRKIGSYQGLKHPCADMLVALERSRSHVAHAATLLNSAHAATRTNAREDEDGEGAELALRMAQAEAKDGLLFAGDRAVQFHGGFGFTWECDAQLYLRRALWLQPWFGDAAHHRKRLADLMWPG